MLDIVASVAAIALLAWVLHLALHRVLPRRWMRWTIAVSAAFFVTGYATLQLSRSRSFQMFGHMVLPHPTPEKLVALTFDDGPAPKHLGEVLELLEREQVRGTFFLIGGAIEEQPAATKRIVAAGHEIGNHSYSHRRMVFKTGSWIGREIERTDALIRSAGYRGPIHFRSPYGKRLISLPLYLARHDRLNVFWDVDPESNRKIARDPDAIRNHVLARVKPGSIVLLHPMYATGEPSRRALPEIIDTLQARGYRFVTVSQLLKAQKQ
ncbi:MAG: polysaccharide deacetylase family protein [Thermoanaerobaculia bacterium]